MTPASLFVWRVRLWLLALAMGLIAVNDDKITVPLSAIPLSSVAHPPAEEPLPAVSRVRTKENGGNGIAATAVPPHAKPTLTKTAIRPAMRAACLDRAASKSRHRMQASATAKQCKPWIAAAGVNTRSTHVVQRQKFTRAANMKRHVAMTAPRRPGSSGAVSKLARKSDGRPTMAAEKHRNGAPRTS